MFLNFSLAMALAIFGKVITTLGEPNPLSSTPLEILFT